MKQSYPLQKTGFWQAAGHQTWALFMLLSLLALPSWAYWPLSSANGNPATAKLEAMVTAPKIVSLSPSSASIGSPDLVVTLTGTNFASNSTVFLVGSARPTTVISSTQITVTLSAYDLAQPAGAYALKIMDGTSTSNLINFIVTQAYYTKLTGDLNVLSTYGTNLDGTGDQPTGFVGAGRQFHVSGVNRNPGSSWTVSGTQSKVIVDTNTFLSIPATTAIAALFDISDGATLEMNPVDASGIKLGALAATSNVIFAQNASYVIPDVIGAGYGNLELRNGTKTLPAAPTIVAVRGNLLLNNVSNFGGNALKLGGNLTLNNLVSFDPIAKVALTTTSTAAMQTLDGAGTILELLSLTATAGSQVQLAPSTDLLLGSSTGGGYNLGTGATLSVGANTLRFLAGGQASIGLGTGILRLASSSLVLTKNGPNPLGTLRVDKEPYNVLSSFTVNATGGATMSANDLTLGNAAVPQVLFVTGLFTLGSGQLTIGNNTLTLNGPVSMGAPGTAQFNGSTTSGLEFGGTGAVSTISFAPLGSNLGSLYMNRTDTVTVRVASSPTVRLLTLTRGVLRLLGTNRLIIAPGSPVPSGNGNSFVNSLTQSATTTRTVTTVTMVYPLGTSVGTSYYYRAFKLSITNTANGPGTRSFTARQIEGRPTGRTLPTTLRVVSNIRYFTLGPEPGGTGALARATVGLWANGSDDGITNPSGLRVVRTDPADLTKWQDLGGSYNSPYVTSANFTSLNSPADYILGASTAVPGNPLPVTLTALEAQRQSNGSVLVQWSTATEENNAYFEVERSTDGLAFGPVGQVPGNGTSSQARAYRYDDTKAPNGLLYYRLRQVDADGQSTYSRVVVVTGRDAAAQVALYPNPATDQFTLTLPVALANQPVRVFDLQGRLVTQLVRNSIGNFEVNSLAAGTYFVHVDGGGVSINQRFVKL